MRFLKAPEMEEESRREILVEPLGVRLKSPKRQREWEEGFFSQRLLACFIFHTRSEVVAAFIPKL